jgi:hypothetical protein
MRKLKWRELATVKAVVGNLSDKNRFILKDPEVFSSLHKPYVEAGVGVENILKILRIDGIWRLSYLQNPDIAKFGIRASIQVTF